MVAVCELLSFAVANYDLKPGVHRFVLLLGVNYSVIPKDNYSQQQLRVPGSRSCEHFKQRESQLTCLHGFAEQKSM